jgi:hypothetical protein
MNEKQHSFYLSPKSESRYNAGEYDPKTRTPKCEIDCLCPTPESRNQIEIDEIIMGNEGSYILVWDIKNDSTWPIFFDVKRDGQLVIK